MHYESVLTNGSTHSNKQLMKWYKIFIVMTSDGTCEHYNSMYMIFWFKIKLFYHIIWLFGFEFLYFFLV